jgi:hypothetical protein
MTTKVNELQAYKAMFLFLEKYNEGINADEINILLGSMDLSIFGTNERPADPAMWNEWTQCIQEILHTPKKSKYNE